ncbi:MAG: ABC transporter ATP-binding protein [Chitinophagaceae bacterium]|nr:ABC transporter ATP-binding protein [Chitinophagaceae bacterium]
MNVYSEHNCLIEINHLGVKYGDKVILRDIGNETIPFRVNDVKREGMLQGQIVAILGRSGRGKSTLFRNLAGIEKPSSGRIIIPKTFEGTEYKNIAEGDVGFVQQTFPLSRNQSVYEMLQDAVAMGDHKEPADKIIDEYLREWGLTAQKNQYANQLSGGQRQRVAIIEQLLCSHFFIVLDEPFSGLDVKNIEEVKDAIQKLTSSSEINTVLFSTHNIELAVSIADSIYLVGYEKDDQGNFKEGGTLLTHYDLKKMGIAWTPYSKEHIDIAEKLKKKMLES